LVGGGTLADFIAQYGDIDEAQETQESQATQEPQDLLADTQEEEMSQPAAKKGSK